MNVGESDMSKPNKKMIEKIIVETKISEILSKKLAGENLSRVARELGISKSLLSDWVAARRIPSLKNIDSVKKVADYLGLSLEHLLLGKEDDRKIISNVVFEDGSRRYRINVERLK